MSKKIFHLFLVIFSLCSTAKSQSNRAIRKFDKFDTSTVTLLRLPTVQLIGIDKEVEQSMKIALSYFPELKAKKIIFKTRKIQTTLNARPTVGSLLFSNRRNRTYVIRINNSKNDSIIVLDAVPFNAQIGLLAHEISHFIDYQNKSFFGILGRGFAYASKSSKSKFEKEIDLATIQKGLGWQLYDWSYFVLNQSNASVQYKKFKQETYLKPFEIKLFIEQSFAH